MDILERQISVRGNLLPLPELKIFLFQKNPGSNIRLFSWYMEEGAFIFPVFMIINIIDINYVKFFRFFGALRLKTVTGRFKIWLTTAEAQKKRVWW